MTTAVKKPATKAPAMKAKDAIALLRADHKEVSELFDEFEKTRSRTRKKELATQICNELTVHAQIEEEIFYPAAKQALKDKDLVAEAIVEHATLKDLISQIEADDEDADSEMYDAKVKVLSEYVKHHVAEEQNEMFPQVKATHLDLVELGAQLAARKEELLAQKQQEEEGMFTSRRQNSLDVGRAHDRAH